MVGDLKNTGDQNLDKMTDAKGGDSSVARNEAMSGMKDLADQSKQYVADRKAGKAPGCHTGEICGPKPEFFDSSAGTENYANYMGAKVGDKGDVHKNASGQPDKVTYPNGDSASIKYDKDHNPNEIKNNDGSRMTRDADGNGWTRYDQHGKKSDHLDGSVKVDNDGTITAQRKDGFKEVERPDGSSQTTYPDKTVVDEKNDKVQAVTRPDGTKSEVKYGADGKPSEITNVDGTDNVWKKENGKWNVHYPDGTVTDSGMKDVNVNDRGEVVMKGTAGNGMPLERTIKPDGSEENTYTSSDGSKTTYHTTKDAEGLHPAGATTKHRDGSTTEFREDGSSKHTSRDGKVTETPPPSKKDWHSDSSWDDPSGKTRYFENGEGDKMKVDDKGTRTITYKSDGREEVIEKDNTSTTTWPGQKGHLRVYPDGRREDTRSMF